MSDYVIVVVRLCPEVGNDEYSILYPILVALA